MEIWVFIKREILLYFFQTVALLQSLFIWSQYSGSRGALIVGILGKTKSPLGEKVDVLLDASVNEEADPLGIVPTASFAAAAALGDAIGSALMKRRNFDSNEYAKTHPAGQLGRNLILKVDNVYHTKTKVACLAKEAKLKEAVIEMSRFPLGAACVLENGKLLGIITDGDLRRDHS